MDVKVENNKLRVACRSYRIGFGALSLSSWNFALSSPFSSNGNICGNLIFCAILFHVWIIKSPTAGGGRWLAKGEFGILYAFVIYMGTFVSQISGDIKRFKNHCTTFTLDDFCRYYWWQISTNH